MDPALDLLLERAVAVTARFLWRGWTDPEVLKQWFTPPPWRSVECEIDLRPGGRFRTVMRAPEGQEFENVGCYLEIIPNEKLVWTGALGPGFRPRPATSAAGTPYSALVIHGDEESCRQHEKMGFRQGWGLALDQLLAPA